MTVCGCCRSHPTLGSADAETTGLALPHQFLPLNHLTTALQFAKMRGHSVVYMFYIVNIEGLDPYNLFISTAHDNSVTPCTASKTFEPLRRHLRETRYIFLPLILSIHYGHRTQFHIGKVPVDSVPAPAQLNDGYMRTEAGVCRLYR